MANPFRSGDDDDVPMQSGSLYDVRTIPKYQDSSDEEVQAESLYDVRTMGGDAPEEDEAPLPPPPRRAPEPAPAPAPVKPPRQSGGYPTMPSQGSHAQAVPSAMSSVPPPLPKQRVNYEVPPPPPARRSTASSGSVYPPSRQGSGPDFDAGLSQHMRSVHVGDSAPQPPPPRAAPTTLTSKWWETNEHASGYLNAPWFHKEISREEAEARLGHFPLNTYLVRAGGTPGFVLSVRSTEKFMHVRIEYRSNNFYIASHEFTSLQEIVEFYRSHDYAKDHKLATVCPLPAEPAPAAADTHDYHAPPPPPRDRTATAMSQARPAMRAPPPAPVTEQLVFGDTVYVDAEKEDAEAERRRAMNIQQLPLPRDPRDWNEGEVIRFLIEHDLGAFKEPFYNNAITGARFVKLRGDQFRRGGFSDAQCAALQVVIDQARHRAGL